MSEELEGIPLSVHRISTAIKVFEETDGGIYDSVYKDDEESLPTDLLVDLQHWADAKGLNFEEHLRVAQGHHDDEVESTKGENQCQT